MSLPVISTYDDLQAVLGKDLGPGDWSHISEEQAQLFETICLAGPFDFARKSRDCTTTRPAFADGSLLLSLLGRLRTNIAGLRFDYPSRMNIFYGFDKVRFFDPVRVPATVRLHLRIVDARMIDPGTIHVVYGHRLETSEGRTALLANAINRIYLKEPRS